MVDFHYNNLIERNNGYIDDALQQRIRATTLMIAGCGIGSGTAMCAARMGFERFILIDGDTVSTSNLNRQFFDLADVGIPKVDALKKQIHRVNPDAPVETLNCFLDQDNTDAIVARADIIFDTIDFLDLAAILKLHASAKQHNKPIITALSAGFGALLWYFPAGSTQSLADILAPDIASATGTGPAAYADVFASFFRRIGTYFDPEVIENVSHVIAKMRDNAPCPASQVSPGAFGVATIAVSTLREILSGRTVPESPQIIFYNFKTHSVRIVNISTLPL